MKRNRPEEKLRSLHVQYFRILEKLGKRTYSKYRRSKKEGAQFFLKNISLPRRIFHEEIGKKDLNPGAVAGIILEWILYFLVKAAFEKNKYIAVFNSYPVPFKWKEKGYKRINVDLAVGIRNLNKPLKLKKLIYLVEVKTNFADGFSNYCRQERTLYHLRTRSTPCFRYHYLAFSGIPAIFNKRHKHELQRIRDHGELWVFEKDKYNIDNAKNFLDAIFRPFSLSKK